jgi:hypothetical protein
MQSPIVASGSSGSNAMLYIRIALGPRIRIIYRCAPSYIHVKMSEASEDTEGTASEGEGARLTEGTESEGEGARLAMRLKWPPMSCPAVDWDVVLAKVVALVCVHATYTIACCWLARPPSISAILPLCLPISAFVLLNSVEYSVLSSDSDLIRKQAITLVTFCYLIFFVGFVWRLLLPEERCRRADLYFVATTIITGSMLRFVRPMLLASQCVNTQHLVPRDLHFDTWVLILACVSSALLIVTGATLQLMAILDSKHIIAVTIPLPHAMSFPILWCVDQSQRGDNPDCVWAGWHRFLATYLYGTSVAWPLCLSAVGWLRYSETVEATVGVLCTIVGCRMAYHAICLVSKPSYSNYMHLH